MVRSLDSLLNGSWDCSLDFSFVDGLLDGSSDDSSDGRRCRRMVRPLGNETHMCFLCVRFGSPCEGILEATAPLGAIDCVR